MSLRRRLDRTSTAPPATASPPINVSSATSVPVKGNVDDGAWAVAGATAGGGVDCWIPSTTGASWQLGDDVHSAHAGALMPTMPPASPPATARPASIRFVLLIVHSLGAIITLREL